MAQINLPTELLRTFVTVIEVDSFTHAAALLGRTQPAVSLQMKRLEELVGQPLVLRDGRSLFLTDKGTALIEHARQILRLNDLAVSQFDTASQNNALRIGLPVDYGVRMLQSCLTDIIHRNPEIQMEIRCDLSRNLINALHQDELDVAVGLYPGGDQQFLHQSWVEKPVWVAAKNKSFANTDTLPLVTHQQGCVYRDRMTDALKRTQRRWRIAFSSPGITSVQQAVLDGLGVSCLTGPTMLAGLTRLSANMDLPELEPLHIGLFYRQTRLAQSDQSVITEIETTLKQAVA